MTRVAPCALLIGAMLVLSGCEKSTPQPKPVQPTAKPAAAQAEPAATQQKPAAKTVAASDDPFAPVDKASAAGSSATSTDLQGPILPNIDQGALPEHKAPAVTPVGKDAKAK
jgi:hypothetical protein